MHRCAVHDLERERDSLTRTRPGMLGSEVESRQKREREEDGPFFLCMGEKEGIGKAFKTDVRRQFSE